VHLPYWVGAAAVLAAAGVLAVSRRHLVGHHTAAEQPGEQSGEQSGVVASAR